MTGEDDGRKIGDAVPLPPTPPPNSPLRPRGPQHQPPPPPSSLRASVPRPPGLRPPPPPGVALVSPLAPAALGQVAVAAVVFLILAAAWTELTGRYIGPALIANLSINDLSAAARTLTDTLFAGIGAAGFVSGLVVAARGRRASRSAVISQAVAGTLVTIAALLVIADIAHLPIERRATAMNAVVAAVGALLGALAWMAWRPYRRREALGRPARLGLAICFLLILTQLAPAREAKAADDIAVDDCALTAQETVLSAEFTVFSINAGRTWMFTQKEVRRDPGEQGQPVDANDPDHLWQDTVDVGIKAGFKATFGEHVGAKLVHIGGGQGVAISITSDATADLTSSYPGLPKDSADDVIRWSLNRYGLSVLALPVLTKFVLPTLTSQRMVTNVPPPKSTEIQLGSSAHIEVSAGELINYTTTVDIAQNAAITLENDANQDIAYVDDPDLVSFVLELEGNGTTGVEGPIGGLSGHLDGDLVLTLTVGRQPTSRVWTPSEVELETTDKITAGAELALIGKTLGEGDLASKKAIGTLLRRLTASDVDEHGASLELGGSVDLLEHPDVLEQVGAVYLAARQADRKRATAADRIRLRQVIRTLATTVDRDAVVHVKVFSVDTGTIGIDLEDGDGLAFGGSVERESTSESLVWAGYRNVRHQVRTSQTCRK